MLRSPIPLRHLPVPPSSEPSPCRTRMGPQCSHLIFRRPLVSRCPCYCAESRSPRARELPLPRTPYGGQERHSSTQSKLATPCTGATFASVARLRPKEAFSDAIQSGGATTGTAPSDAVQLGNAWRLAPEQPCLGRPMTARGGTLRRSPIWQRHALELPLPWSPFDGQRRHFPTQFELTSPCTGATTACVALRG